MQKRTNPVSYVRRSTDGAAPTGTINSNKVNTGGYGTVKAFLHITAIGGSPTLDVKFQDSPNGNDSWVDVPSGAIPQKNAVGDSSLVLANVGPYLRAVQTVGGTGTPTATYDLTVCGVQ